jgi:hypothetical protein
MLFVTVTYRSRRKPLGNEPFGGLFRSEGTEEGAFAALSRKKCSKTNIDLIIEDLAKTFKHRDNQTIYIAGRLIPVEPGRQINSQVNSITIALRRQQISAYQENTIGCPEFPI